MRTEDETTTLSRWIALWPLLYVSSMLVVIGIGIELPRPSPGFERENPNGAGLIGVIAGTATAMIAGWYCCIAFSSIRRTLSLGLGFIAFSQLLPYPQIVALSIAHQVVVELKLGGGNLLWQDQAYVNSETGGYFFMLVSQCILLLAAYPAGSVGELFLRQVYGKEDAGAGSPKSQK